jgi:SAM-dependent methyltransferase
MEPLSDISSASDEFETKYVRPKFGRTLICGSKVYKGRIDRRQRYQVAVGIDMEWGPGVDLVMNLEETLPYTLGHFAHVECRSVLEHSRQPWLLAANIERLLEPGGTLHVAVPFAWAVHGYPDDFWRFTASAIRLLFPRIEWSALMYGNQGLTDEVLRVKVERFWYFPRSEVLGFGHRCAS